MRYHFHPPFDPLAGCPGQGRRVASVHDNGGCCLSPPPECGPLPGEPTDSRIKTWQGSSPAVGGPSAHSTLGNKRFIAPPAICRTGCTTAAIAGNVTCIHSASSKPTSE